MGYCFFNRRNYVARTNVPCTLKLSGCVFVSRAEKKIAVLEGMTNIMPTTIAYMSIEDPIWRFEFIRRMGKAGNHHNGRSCSPSKPA